LQVWGLLVPAGSIAVRFLKHKPAHQAFHKWTMLTAVRRAGVHSCNSTTCMHMRDA